MMMRGPLFIALRVLLALGVVAALAMLPVMALAQAAIPRAAEAHRNTLLREARMVWGLGAPTASFAAQVHQESRWKSDARSPVGAQGLTQFMPATAQWIGTTRADLAQVDTDNPRWALRALVVYDKWLYARVAGQNECERMAFAMSAYNGGLGWVQKRKARSKTPLLCLGLTCDINPGITAANQRENAHYPRKILLQYEPLYEASGRWGKGVCP